MSTADEIQLMMRHAERRMEPLRVEFGRLFMRSVVHGLAAAVFGWRVVGHKRARLLRRRGELVVPASRPGSRKKAFVWLAHRTANKVLA